MYAIRHWNVLTDFITIQCLKIHSLLIVLLLLYFLIGFKCTVLTKTRTLAGSLAGDVLGDAILIPPHIPIPTTNIKK